MAESMVNCNALFCCSASLLESNSVLKEFFLNADSYVVKIKGVVSAGTPVDSTVTLNVMVQPKAKPCDDLM